MKGRRGFAVGLLVLFGMFGWQRLEAAPSLWVGPPMKKIDPPFERFYRLLENGKFGDSRIYGKASVVLLYPKYAREGEVADMRPFMANLRAAGRQVAFEGPLLKLGPDKCGQTLESFGFIPARALLDKLHQAGAPLDWMVIDEPVWYASVFHGAHACGYSPQELAKQIAESIRILHRQYPHLRFGQVEPIGAPRTQKMLGAVDAYLSALSTQGVHLDFMQFDVLWVPGWQKQVEALAKIVRRHGLKVGLIVNESHLGLSDEAWNRAALEHYRAAVPLIHPDQIVVQSWVTRPSVEAGDRPGTFSALVKAVSGQMDH